MDDADEGWIEDDAMTHGIKSHSEVGRCKDFFQGGDGSRLLHLVAEASPEIRPSGMLLVGHSEGNGDANGERVQEFGGLTVGVNVKCVERTFHEIYVGRHGTIGRRRGGGSVEILTEPIEESEWVDRGKMGPKCFIVFE